MSFSALSSALHQANGPGEHSNDVGGNLFHAGSAHQIRVYNYQTEICFKCLTLLIREVVVPGNV